MSQLTQKIYGAWALSMFLLCTPWYLTGYRKLSVTPYRGHTFSILISPAGDAKQPGRTIDDSFERSITLQYAQELKKKLEKTGKHVSVVITRQPGQTTNQQYNAQYANRLAVDLYLSIHAYHTNSTAPQIHLYTVAYGNEFVQLPASLHFCPYDQAHLYNHTTTATWADNLYTQLLQQHLLTVHPPAAVPCMPLVGITAPAICIEFGLHNSSDWHTLVAPVANALQTIIKT